jgi:hypothetical protein
MLKSISVLLVLAGNLVGCAYVHSFRSDLPAQIDAWVEQQEYGKALDTLNYIEPSHKQYYVLQEKRERIETLAGKFENNTIKQATELWKQGEWHEADITYETALKKIPESQTLKNAHLRFLEKRDDYIAKHEVKILLTRADQLARELPELTAIQRVIPRDSDINERLKQARSDAQNTAAGLADEAEKALAANDVAFAGKCVKLAKPLFPNEETRNRIAMLETRIAEYKTAKSRLEMAADLQFQQGLLNRFNDAYRTRDLLTAKKVMQQIMAQDVKPPDANVIAHKLDTAIDERIKEALVTGRSLYSRGKIQEAVTVWQEVLPLQPDNRELKEHIERADRVLEKLRKLSAQPSANKGESQGSSK